MSLPNEEYEQNYNGKKFKFLKRGEGTARFGKLGQPWKNFQNQEKFNRSSSQPGLLTQNNTEKVMTSASAPTTARVNRKPESDSGCEDAPVSASDRGYQPSPQSISLSDTNQFERLERDLGDASISGDSTFYHQFISSVHKFPNRRKSSPRITEIDEESESKKRFPAGFDNGTPLSKRNESIESGTISSLRSSERNEYNGKEGIISGNKLLF